MFIMGRLNCLISNMHWDNPLQRLTGFKQKTRLKIGRTPSNNRARTATTCELLGAGKVKFTSFRP